MRALPLLALALAGCATAGAPPQSGEDDLARVIGKRVAGEPVSCVSTSLIDDTRIIDETTLVYGRTGTIYVNRLESRCPNLHPTNTIITEIRGGQLCRNDMFRVKEPTTTIPGPFCRLGEFTPYRLPKDQPGG